MRKGISRARALGLALVLAVVFNGYGSTLAAEPEQKRALPDLGWIVVYRQQQASWGSFKLQSVTGDADIRSLGGDRESVFRLDFDGDTLASDAISRLLADPAVAFVEPVVAIPWQLQPNDPFFSQQSWATTSKFPESWDIGTGKPDTIVAVVDSGVRANHPDLEGNVLPGYDFLNYDDDPTDDVGHGTGVAGIIAARGNDGIGIAGGAMDVSILPVKVGDQQWAYTDRIYEGVVYAVDHGASVINLSLGLDSPNSTVERAINYAYDRNVVVVASSGNSPNQPWFPASYQRVISVGASNEAGDSVAQFSSRISRVDLAAPGENVVTTYWGPNVGNVWAKADGTSFSAPMVSATIALMRSANPALSIEEIRAILTSTATRSFPEDQLGGGAGLLNASAAIKRALNWDFASRWEPQDEPVTVGAAQRTWLWGPNAFHVGLEPYRETQHGNRLVAYFDKSRMEVTNPYGDRNSVWYVTNGLLVNELMSGQLQTGEAQFETRAPAELPVAGDPDDTSGPVYASFQGVRRVPALGEGAIVSQTIDRGGQVGDDQRLAGYGVTATDFIPETGHRVASVFRDYLNSTGLVVQNGQYQSARLFDPTYYATGYPVTEAYWARVKLAGRVQDVLIQCFERRCLTYAPSNPDGWQVEMGNVGAHYYRWRFGELPAGPVPDDPAGLALSR